ncbi:PREDICTED: RING1 and YY1-binding protein [Dipodomys ordii]|uniref:RING1 and YY1-binding protein n=1 Tax=Dipodomys ordii TaxID=10020 RepID=A0A1S3EN76_DIPOR|nr:PREDICTED: RING1 and YY1-binding protein [Dipodomys ordii]
MVTLPEDTVELEVEILLNSKSPEIGAKLQPGPCFEAPIIKNNLGGKEFPPASGGRASVPGAGTSGEARTKLRVAEEHKCAGREDAGQRRPCRLPGNCKPRGVAAVASPHGARKLRGTTSPGRLRGQRPSRGFTGAAAKGPKSVASSRARPRCRRAGAPGCRFPGPRKGWVVARERSFQRRLDSCGMTTAHQALCFFLPVSPPPFPAHPLAPLPSVPHSSRRPKRQAKPTADEGFWDCSVCTFRNSAEAFKCSICDVRKGTSTRKPRINSQLVAQQVAQQYATPPPPKKEKKEKVEKQDREKPEKDKEISPSVTKKNTNKKTKPKSDILKDPPSEANSIQSANATTKTSETNHTSRPRLKNVDRSTAQQLAVTVGNVTVIITDFKEKTRSSSTSSSTVTSSAGSEQQNQSSSGSESTDKGSSRSSTPKGDMSAVNDESF